MFESAWNTIKEWFVSLYRFFVYGEYEMAKGGIYLIMFLVIALLFIHALSSKKGKGRAINSPFLFVLAIALTVFTMTL